MIERPRLGSRPRVSTEGPQRQLSDKSPPEIWGRLVAEVFELNGVVEAHSQVSPASTRAVFLLNQPSERAPETSLAPGLTLEPVHLHGVDDTSLHLCLPKSRGQSLGDLGWAEPHQFGDFGTEFLVYGPRSHEEVAAVLSMVEESIEFARGRSSA